MPCRLATSHNAAIQSWATSASHMSFFFIHATVACSLHPVSNLRLRPNTLPPIHALNLHRRGLLCIFLGILFCLFIKYLSPILILVRGILLHCIIRYGLHKKLLSSSQDAHDLTAWFPRLWFEDSNAHAAVLVEGDVWVEDTGFERDLGGLERVVGWEDEEELEFSALGKDTVSVCRTKGEGESAWEAYSVRRAFWAVHYDVPVVYISFVHEADFDSRWGVGGNFRELLSRC
jgi:hypothetical protein